MTVQNDDLQIYIATHKQWELPQQDRGYVPMHVGKAASELDLGILGDDTGENISVLNPYYCELTALYWMWKNSHASRVGLVHYRRYFAPVKAQILLKNTPIASSEDFEELRDECDLIVLMPDKFINAATQMPISVEQQYSMWSNGLDLALTREAIEQLDKSYVSCWDFVMRSNACSTNNMFVGKKKYVDDYCEWLFEILFKLQDWIPYRDYNAYERRVFGFLAERLFNVWIAKNRKHVRVRYRHLALPR